MLIAIGSRDAARIPALAVEINARIAAMAIIPPPIPPRIGIASAPREIGVREVPRSKGLVNPIVTKITSKYSSDIMPQDKNIPRGIFRPGSLHSSAILQTLVKPPNETKIRPAVENIEP